LNDRSFVNEDLLKANLFMIYSNIPFGQPHINNTYFTLIFLVMQSVVKFSLKKINPHAPSKCSSVDPWQSLTMSFGAHGVIFAAKRFVYH
jgi:hypothetical protein